MNCTADKSNDSNSNGTFVALPLCEMAGDLNVAQIIERSHGTISGPGKVSGMQSRPDDRQRLADLISQIKSEHAVRDKPSSGWPPLFGPL
jgi:hypothetical protein